MKRVLVTGSRKWPTEVGDEDWGTVWDAIQDERENGEEIVVVHGDARGADQIARMFAEFHENTPTGAPVHHDPVPCPSEEWERYGKAAGNMRNQKMVDKGADVCLAFPIGKSTGTRDCMRRADDAKIPVKVFHLKDSK